MYVCGKCRSFADRYNCCSALVNRLPGICPVTTTVMTDQIRLCDSLLIYKRKR